MKTNGGFLVTKIKQLGDRIFDKWWISCYKNKTAG